MKIIIVQNNMIILFKIIILGIIYLLEYTQSRSIIEY